MADDLNALGADAIARDERVRAFDRLQLPPQATLTRGTVIKIGQLVGATTVVTGRVELVDRTLALHVQSVRIDTGRISLEFDERGRLEDLLAIVERAARRLVPGGAGAARADATRPSLPAFELFIKGLLAETPDAQVAYLEKALALEPAFDRARLALGRAHAVTGDWQKARDAALSVPAGSPYAARAQLEAAVAEIALTRYDDAFARLKTLGEQTGAPEVFNNLGVIQLRRGADRAKRPLNVFLQPGRRGRSRPGRLRVQPGLCLLAGAGLYGRRVLVARGRATCAWRQRRALCPGGGVAGHGRRHRGSAGARAGAAPVGRVRGAGAGGRRRCRPSRSRAAPAIPRPAWSHDGRTRR